MAIDDETAIASPAKMRDARFVADVRPAFPGLPLEDNYSRSLSLEQFEHVEDTYCDLVAGMKDIEHGRSDYSYILALLEQLIHDHRYGAADEERRAAKEEQRAARRRRVQ